MSSETQSTPANAFRRGPRRFDIVLLTGALIALSAFFLIRCEQRLQGTLQDGERIKRLLSGDTGHYLTIAALMTKSPVGFEKEREESRYERMMKTIKSGISYNEYMAVRVPHRQPLYPTLLAAAQSVFGQGLAVLGRVNIWVSLLSLLAVVLIGTTIFDSPIAGLSGALVLAFNPFVPNYAATLLLTEPTFLLCSLLAIYGFLGYLKFDRSTYLYIASAAAGLTYLARPNGMFLTLSMFGCLVLNEIWLAFRKGTLANSSLLPRAKRLMLAGVIVVLVTTPSWIPRVYYHGKPVYHGYLSNFMWVDTYKEGSAAGPPRYSFKDYAVTHTAGDAMDRLKLGFHFVFHYAMQREYGRFQYWLIAASLAVALLGRRRPILFLLIFGFVQLLPIIWTAKSNPTPRISVAAILPFAAVLITYAISVLLGLGVRTGLMGMASINRSGTSESPAND